MRSPGDVVDVGVGNDRVISLLEVDGDRNLECYCVDVDEIDLWAGMHVFHLLQKLCWDKNRKAAVNLLVEYTLATEPVKESFKNRLVQMSATRPML